MKRLLDTIAKKVLSDYYYDFALWFLFFRKTPVPTGNRKNLLILNHMFEQDIEALKIANKDFNFIILSGFILRFLGTGIFPPSVESYRAYNSPSMDATKRRYRKIVERFAERLRRKYRIAAMISPSDNFFYVRELIPALHARGIPFIVVDKEGTICPAYFIHFAEYIRNNCPLIADRVLVWSERQRLFWKKTGVDSSKISVTGQPRSDFWCQQFRWKKKSELGIKGLRLDKKTVLFFTYDPWAYTPDYMVEKGEMHWDILRSETHETIFEFAKVHPDLDVVIKAHPQQLDLDEIRKEIADYDTTNVLLATGPELSNHLIVNADAIIGFQTTALIESMITDKPIIYTFWGEAREKWSKDLIPFHETKGILTARDPGELRILLEENIAHPKLAADRRNARDSFVREYLSDIDGRASERTLAEITSFLDRQR